MPMNLRASLAYQPLELSFGTSGLRGLVTDMTDLECYINSAGFLLFLKQTESLKKGAAVSIAGDLRKSTPRILGAVIQAIEDTGFKAEYCGLIPTPALAFWAKEHNQPCIMVTGSHIPDDRNGIKFYKSSGEVLKQDEVTIQQAVATVRADIYNSLENTFDSEGSLITFPELPDPSPQPAAQFIKRFLAVIPANAFAGKHLVVYQHSAVGRDMLVEVLEKLGAKVTPVDRSDAFISIDTENVTPEDQAHFHSIARQHPDTFAIVSTDGDSDRPFVIDEEGEFHRGDVLGFIVAKELAADFAAIPITSSDAVDSSLDKFHIAWQHTKIGSPHVIVAMQNALLQKFQKVVGWEVNGGFLTGTDLPYGNGILKALPTRDAFLPILIALYAAVKSSVSISQLFSALPPRFTQAGLIDNFPQIDSQKIIEKLSKNDDGTQELITTCFGQDLGFEKIKKVDTTDGIRIFFSNNEIAHIRASGNAPQLRMYSVASSQKRADEIIELGIQAHGILTELQESV